MIGDALPPIPDVVAPIRAIRCWKVDGKPPTMTLFSVNGTVWSPGRPLEAMSATCFSDRGPLRRRYSLTCSGRSSRLASTPSGSGGTHMADCIRSFSCPRAAENGVPQREEPLTVPAPLTEPLREEPSPQPKEPAKTRGAS